MVSAGGTSGAASKAEGSAECRIEPETLRAALDALAVAALILGPEGRIVFRNSEAAIELAEASLLRECNGHLLGSSPDAGRLLVELRRWSQAGRTRARDMVLTGSDGDALHASWTELKAHSPSERCLLLLLRRPATELKTPLMAAAALYKLTAGEAQVLAHILNGRSLSEAAEVLGVRRSTVKSHLHAIYRKTETHRQAELIRLTVGLASPLR